MSFLSSLVRTAAPVVATVAPFFGPQGVAVAAGAGLIAQDTARKRAKEARAVQQGEIAKMAAFDSNFRSAGLPTLPIESVNYGSTGSTSSGFFGGISDFFRGAGTVVRDAFGSGIPQLFGVGRPQGVAQQPALTVNTAVGARESAGSGTIDAFAGLGPGLVGAARSLVRSPLGQTSIGTGLGLGLSMIGGDGRQVRITRKTKRLAQQAYALAMGDLSTATSIFAQLSGMSVNEQQFVLILTKRFRNDGPVITQAALRKTKSTIRRMKSMCDMYDSLRRPAARRASPMRRARSTTTLIKN